MIAGLEAAAMPPPPSARIGAIVQASVFDPVNGIEPRYAFYHVAPAAPHGASRAAAAAGAAYTALVALIQRQIPGPAPGGHPSGPQGARGSKTPASSPQMTVTHRPDLVNRECPRPRVTAPLRRSHRRLD
jgi:hypothetical protein